MTLNPRTTAQPPKYADAEVPVPAADGSIGCYTLAYAPYPALSLQLYRNGLMQQQGLDYTLAGNAITFLPGCEPQPDDTLLAFYRH